MNYFCFYFMKRFLKFKPNYLFRTTLIALLLCITTTKIFGTTNFYRPLTSFQDTTKPISRNDASKSNITDTIPSKQKVDTFSLKISHQTKHLTQPTKILHQPKRLSQQKHHHQPQKNTHQQQ